MSEPLPPLREELWELEISMRNTRTMQALRRRDRTEFTESKQGRRWTDIRLFAVDRCPQCGEWRWNKTCPVRAYWSQIIHERKTA